MLAASAQSEVLKSPEQFIRDAFTSPPERQVLWLNQALKSQILSEIGYQFHQLRVRYWSSGSRSAWVLEEVGKEEPITIGVVVDSGQIKEFKVLIYRESRGHEVKHDFYTRQFLGARLISRRNRLKLSEGIDGITGATLSVRATKKVATLALFLHQQTDHSRHVEKN